MSRDDIIQIYKEANGWSPKGFENTVDELERFAALVAAAEREACAKVCENVVSNEGYVQSKWCVDAIRARGQA
jgi:hypothetical protein